MPRASIDYSNSCVYKITCKDPEVLDSYVGSTTNLKKRSYCHKSAATNICSSGYKFNLYTFIRAHGGFENFTVDVVEDVPCTTANELTLQERKVFDLLKPTLNSNRPSITAQERKAALKKYRDEHKETQKAYILKNNAVIVARRSETIECPCGRTIMRRSLSSHRKTNFHKAHLNEIM
jgi:hypothetical protein